MSTQKCMQDLITQNNFKVTDRPPPALSKGKPSGPAPTAADWSKDLLCIPKEYEYQFIPHPVITKLEPRPKIGLPNRFLESLYVKYPFLVPRPASIDKLHLVRETAPDNIYTTSYNRDYCIKATVINFILNDRIPGNKKELINMVRCPLMKVADDEKYQVRDPGRPYLWRVHTSEISEGDKTKWKRIPSPAAPPLKVKFYKPSSEYNDNINRMGKLIYKLGVHTKPYVEIKRQGTIPPFIFNYTDP